MVVAATCAAACATGATPDRGRVGADLGRRVGIETQLAAPPEGAWTPPAGAVTADGLDIDEAVAIALWSNPDFHASLTALGLARADVVEAGLLRNPIFSLLFPWGPKQLEFTLTWPIDALWQRPKRVADATLNAEAIAAHLVAGGLTLVADVRLAFLDAVLAERQAAFGAEQSTLASQAATMAEGRLRAGDVSALEASLVRADALRFEAVRVKRQGARDQAMVRLRALLGVPSGTAAFTLVDPMETADVCATGAALLASALAARPEVRAAELQVEAAGARVGLERARILTLTASLDANAKGSQGFEMGPGVAIELPVLSQNQGRRARAAAELDQAARRYLAVRAAVSVQLDAAIAGLQEAQETARLLTTDAAASLQEARQRAERLHQAGEISLLALLETRQRLIDIETARLDAAFGVSRALVRLEQAIGHRCQT